VTTDKSILRLSAKIKTIITNTSVNYDVNVFCRTVVYLTRSNRNYQSDGIDCNL